MTIQLTDAQKQRWHFLHQQYLADTQAVAKYTILDQKRLTAQQDLVGVLIQFFQGNADVETFREMFDQKSHSVRDTFGIEFSGGMFINKLVKNVPEQSILTHQLRYTLHVPHDKENGRVRMRAFLQYLESLIASQYVRRNQVDPRRVLFFFSFSWHIQSVETWPVFYSRTREALEEGKVYIPNRDPLEDCFGFRDSFLRLAAQLKVVSWELEHLCEWRIEKQM